MSCKSEVVVLDVLMKNEAKHGDMLDIMMTMQGYLGKDYPPERRVPSGGDQLTCEHQIGAQRHMMDGDTPEERLGLLQPQCEDWHCLVCVLRVSSLYTHNMQQLYNTVTDSKTQTELSFLCRWSGRFCIVSHPGIMARWDTTRACSTATLSREIPRRL